MKTVPLKVYCFFALVGSVLGIPPKTSTLRPNSFARRPAFSAAASSQEGRTSSEQTVHHVTQVKTENLPQASATNTPNSDESWPSLFDETRDMLEVASLIYSFAELRNLHNDGKIKINDRKLAAKTVRDPIEAGQLYNFVSKNKDTVIEKLGEAGLGLLDDILNRQIEQENEDPNPALVVFDDSNSNKELVYGININHTLKRIVVVFRGSVTLKDFITDAKIRQTKIPNPVKGKNQARKIGLHSGFKEYLFGDDGSSKTKCKKIIKEVNELLRRYPEYRLYVTGHSLGAALATLFALHVASTDEVKTNGPVTCIPIASPKVGNGAFQKAFRSLEKRGSVRFVRVENDLDVVTVVPNPYTFRFLSVIVKSRLYRHVGVSLKLFKNQPVAITGSPVRHRPLEMTRSFISHVWMLRRFPAVLTGKVDFLDNHSCDEYLERLTKQRSALEPLSLERLIDTKIRSTA